MISNELYKEEHDVLDCTYPLSFVSTSCNESFLRLPLLSCNELLSCVQRFWERVPSGCKSKSAYIKLIESDFPQQMKQLIESSTSELFGHALTLQPADQPMPWFSLVCQAIHNRYRTTIASQLLSSEARWNPPKVMEYIYNKDKQEKVDSRHHWLSPYHTPTSRWSTLHLCSPVISSMPFFPTLLSYPKYPNTTLPLAIMRRGM